MVRVITFVCQVALGGKADHSSKAPLDMSSSGPKVLEDSGGKDETAKSSLAGQFAFERFRLIVRAWINCLGVFCDPEIRWSV